MISYYWPPCGGPGSLRPVKFAKYLPEFGLKPVILTRKNIAYHSLDYELGEGLKGIKIYRTESLDPARILYLFGMRHYRPKRWQVPIKKTLNFPDNKAGWILFAYNAAKNLDFKYILATAPPFSAFICGYMISRKTEKPLILDFRDAWLEFPFMRYENEIQKKFVIYWERKVVEHARLICTVNEIIKSTLISRYPDTAKKISVIPNGFDPSDFPDIPLPEKFTISYLGTIRKERNPEPFLMAVDRFLKESNLSSGTVEIKFIGHIEDEYLRMIKRYPFTKILGHLSYYQAIKEFSNAHLVLMITTGIDYFFPSRENEYLASGLPIISCGNSEGLSVLKSAFKSGYPVRFCEYNDINSIENTISEFYTKFKKREIKKEPHPFPEYTRRNLTKKLAELIKQY